MTITADRTPAAASPARLLVSPLGVLALALGLVVLLMALPIRLPVGPMYWDVFVYYDAANRIFDGQVPVTDFFTPVGPLGYYVFAGWLWLFPDAQPTLIAHWALLAVTAPLMAVVVAAMQERSRAIAFALLVPFLVFALLPFNTREYYPYPGSDGFGVYNRQVCQVLFVLVAALTFLKDGKRLAAIVFATMTALFLLKITGFVSGAIVCLFGFACGRLSLRSSLLSAAGFLATLGLMEISAGMASAYLRDIAILVEMNAEGLFSRFFQAISHTFGILIPATALGCLLLAADRKSLSGACVGAWRGRSAAMLREALDHPGLWLGAVLFAGIFFETQNTGSQAMIFVWPVLLAVLLRADRFIARPMLMIAVFVLAMAAALPPMVGVVERAGRAYAGSVKNLPLDHSNLRALGSVTMRGDVDARARLMRTIYPDDRRTYEKIAAAGQLPSFILYSDYDFQILHLRAIDAAIDSIRALEAAKDIRFDTIMALNFVNPFPWLMDRSAPRHIAIGADPTRAVPPPDEDVTEAVRNADLIVRPTCPPTSSNQRLFDIYEAAMVAHHRIELDACYEAWVHPRFAERLD